MGYCGIQTGKITGGIFLALFLVLMICTSSMTGKEFCKYFVSWTNFLKVYMLLWWNFSACLKSILKTWEITLDNDLVPQFLDAIMNLAPIGFFWSLGRQHIIDREWYFSVSLILKFWN